MAQAALVYAHEQLAIDAIDALDVKTIEQVDRDTATFISPDQPGALVVTIVAETRASAKLTCNGQHPSKAREYRGVAIR